MIRYHPVLATVAVLFSIGGCASPEQQAAEEAYRAPVYRTGSNLPAGRASGESSKELSAADRKTVEDLQNRNRTPGGPGVK